MNISVSRTVRLALARRVAWRHCGRRRSRNLRRDRRLRRGAPPRVDGGNRPLKTKVRRIPFIDPIDIRYRRFETMPKPVAQAKAAERALDDFAGGHVRTGTSGSMLNSPAFATLM